MAAAEQLTSDNLLHALCCQLTGLSGDAVSPYYQFVLQIMGKSATAPVNDEFYYSERIKKKLGKDKRDKDAATFSELYRKLQGYTVITNRSAILCLMLNLLDENKKPKPKSLFTRGLSALITSTPFSFGKDGSTLKSRDKPSFGATLSSVRPASEDPTPLPSMYITPATGDGPYQNGTMNNNNIKPTSGSRILSLNEKRPNRNLMINGGDSNKNEAVDNCVSPTTGIVTEPTLIRELIYIFQGIEGKIIRIETGKDGFRVEPKYGVSKATSLTVLRLAELGWLHNKVKRFYDTRTVDRSLGLVGQSFIAALNQELSEYYRLLAVLEAQLQQDDDPNVNQTGLTLRRLQLWTFEPRARLTVLAALVDTCKGLKGGALASSVYSYLQHGDPCVRGTLRNILASITVPIYTMLDRWIFDGELEDIYREFFVAANPMVLNDKLWHEKYSLRKSMVPSFISMSQAKKILSTGKSINFLRQVCQDSSPLEGRNSISGLIEASHLESLFTPEQEGNLQNMIDAAYTATSRRLIDIMQNTYKFMDHLKALRRYLLLGQGDFIRHLMDILEADLSKPASQLYRHNLSGSLESAIRATNAQFDDPDILRRLDVRLLEVSPGDCGWDVFSLDYHVDGPIGTVFTPSVMMTYLRLFNALWRAKRMEYVLANVWKTQMTHSRLLRTVPELSPVLHQCHILASEMVHFVQQIQYYIAFEVMECSWDVLEKKVKLAGDLDQIIAAHEEFLDTIMARALLDEESKELLTQLRAIYDLIIQLQNIQESLCIRALQEVNRKKTAVERIKANTEKGMWGTDETSSDSDKQIFQELIKSVIPATRAQLRILSQSYQDMVQKFLLMLTSHRDVSLQFLSFRLDFNEHYKNRDSRLRTHLTYQHRRQSSIRVNSVNKSVSLLG